MENCKYLFRNLNTIEIQSFIKKKKNKGKVHFTFFTYIIKIFEHFHQDVNISMSLSYENNKIFFKFTIVRIFFPLNLIQTVTNFLKIRIKQIQKYKF